MWRAIFALALLVLPLSAQQKRQLNDGEMHGDPPFLLEVGVGGSAPSRNASRRPGEWQSFYIWFRAPRFDATGKKTENAKFIRVLHNGLSVQNNVEVDGPTRAVMEHAEAPVNPIMLQGDHGPVAYRNIYVRSLREIIKR
jgi:Domain of Unknown Function (DUF1080)